MLVHRLRRWPNITPPLGYRLFRSGLCVADLPARREKDQSSLKYFNLGAVQILQSDI